MKFSSQSEHLLHFFCQFQFANAYEKLKKLLFVANSDISDKNISLMKIIHYAVLLKGAKFSIFPMDFFINFGKIYKVFVRVCRT